MNELTSTEFRKHYGKLTDPTVVTVNGHAIGMWTPSLGIIGAVEKEHVGPDGERVIDKFTLHSVSTQGQRDDLLRKINRGK